MHKEEKVGLPVVGVDYKVHVINNLARITLKQTYANPLDQNLEIHFSFAKDTDFCFSRLVANFQGYTVEGVIKER